LGKQATTNGSLLNSQSRVHVSSTVAKEALWIKKLVNDLGNECGAVLIQCDNQGTLQVIKHPISSQRSKHIDISHHFMRERAMRGKIKFEYCATDRMPADLLTKALTPAKFESW
jgi:hypothetical protein